MTRVSRHPARTVRADAAAERKEARDARSHQAQLDLLDAKFGKGLGSLKERARLLKLIAEASKPAPKPVEKEEEAAPKVKKSKAKKV